MKTKAESIGSAQSNPQFWFFSDSDAKLKAQPLDRVEVFTPVSLCLLDRLLLHHAALYL
jgi:hypothetical protein